MSAKFIILLMLMMPGASAPQEVRLETQYDTMKDCETAKAEARQQYLREHPDAKVQKIECVES